LPIVEPVDEVERQSHDHQRDDQGQRHGYMVHDRIVPQEPVRPDLIRPNRSSVVDDQPVDLVGDILEAVDHLFEVAVDLAGDEEAHRGGLGMGLECLGEARVVDLVGLAFEAHEALGQLVQARGIGVDRTQQRQRLGDQARASTMIAAMSLISCSKLVTS
jgi:hypothetical protein